jgi:hypothetical protein
MCANEVPTLLGFLDGHHRGSKDTCRLRVFCNYCVVWHEHGVRCNQRRADRVAHCTSRTSPYRKTGYDIEITDIPFSEVENTVRLATMRQQWVIAEGRTTPSIEGLRRQQPTLPRRAQKCSRTRSSRIPVPTRSAAPG